MLLPLPETPVTTVREFKGNFTSMFFKLLWRAPRISTNCFVTLLFCGTVISIFPFRYWAVRESDFKISLKVPSATIFPPKVPASGPISIIISAAFIMSSSCSTTITVFPKSRKSFNTEISLSVSFGCNPILGSSRIYIEPTRLLPREVAKFIRWLSPPDNVFEVLFIVK